MPGVILVVEDEPEIATVLAAYLTRDGFRPMIVTGAGDAVAAHRRVRPDLVLLDVGLSGPGSGRADGFDVLQAIRRDADTPVIMVTARDEDVDRLLGLRLGADDYVVKPFSPPEVVARVAAVLRRTRGARPHEPVLRMGDLDIDTTATSVAVRGVPLSLTATEYRLLEHLAGSPRRTFSRDQLLQAVAPDSDALARVVDAHLANLRRKLTEAGAPGLIATVRGLGYRIEPGPPG